MLLKPAVRSTAQPIAGYEPPAGSQDPEHLGKQRLLVGYLYQGVLRKHDIEARRGEGQRPAVTPDDLQ